MTKDKEMNYDWAAAVLSVAACESFDLNRLAAAANLSPSEGDLSHIDLSGLDLRGQDFTGWDLRHASFKESLVAGAIFTDANIDPNAIVEAIDWISATLPDHLKGDLQFKAATEINIMELGLPDRLARRLTRNGFRTVENVARTSLEYIERIIGAPSTRRVVNALSEIGFKVTTYNLREDSKVEGVGFDRKKGRKLSFMVDYKESLQPNMYISYPMKDEED